MSDLYDTALVSLPGGGKLTIAELLRQRADLLAACEAARIINLAYGQRTDAENQWLSQFMSEAAAADMSTDRYLAQVLENAISRARGEAP
jgi:hypothetical protein